MKTWKPRKATVNEYTREMFGANWHDCKRKAGKVYFIMGGVDVYLNPDIGNVKRAHNDAVYKGGMGLTTEYYIYGITHKQIFIGGE